MSGDARQLDALEAPSRVGGCLEVARDEMLERVETPTLPRLPRGSAPIPGAGVSIPDTCPDP